MASTGPDAAGSSASFSAGKLFSVEGLVALVTGGGTGVGLMMARALVANGAKTVYIAGRRRGVLDDAARVIGPAAVPIECDVSSREQLLAAADMVASRSGHLDLLVCNAGIGGPQVTTLPKFPPPAPSSSPSEQEKKEKQEGPSLAEWRAEHLAHDVADYVRTFEVNVASVWYSVFAFLELLDAGNKRVRSDGEGRGWGSQVVVTSSIAAFNRAAPGGWAYGQSKAAATLAVKQLAVLLPRWNIRVNSIVPGLFPSEMSAPIVKLYGGGDASSGEDGGVTRVPREMVPLGRMGTDEEMAGTMLYLASRAGAYCNGAVIIVDGGRLGNFPSTF